MTPEDEHATVSDMPNPNESPFHETRAPEAPDADEIITESADPAPRNADDAVARLESELADTRDRLLRALAEVDNVRRRGEREREDTAKYAISRFAGDLLSVADNLRRALDSAPQSAIEENEFLAKLVGGVGATERELFNVFEKHGLKRIDPLGQPFDANFHEVLFEMDAPDQPAGSVTQVLEAGYTIGGRLLRPARVAVAKKA
jgi:molecular chaperone GrpE